jgi:hypothetical protein
MGVCVSLDLIDLALDRTTDFAEFERLATEVMYCRSIGGMS